MYKVSTGKFTFWLTGRSVFIRYNSQSMLFCSQEEGDITQNQYAELCHLIYTRKIKTSDDLYELMGRFKLVSTSRSLK